MKKTFIIILFSFILVLAFFLFRNVFDSYRYSKVPVKRGTIKILVATPGKINAEKIADLSFKQTGRIAQLPFKENTDVKKEDVVALLDKNSLLQEVNKAELSVAAARAKVDEFSDTYGHNPGESVLIHQKLQLLQSWEQTRNDLEIAQQNLRDLSLYAPFDGKIIQVNGEINEWTSSFNTEPLVRIVDFSTVYFDGEVAQDNSGDIAQGQRATVKLDAKGDNIIEGEVYEVENTTKTTQAGDVVVPVKIRLQTNLESLKLGWEGDAEIFVAEENDAILVPKEAVKRNQGNFYVNLWSDGYIVTKLVKIGAFDGVNWEIKEGLVGTETLAVSK